MAQLDPTKLHVDSKALPIWDQEPESFQDIMAQQLAHAPWFMLSGALHAVLFFVLYILFPNTPKDEEKIEVQVQIPEEIKIDEPIATAIKPLMTSRDRCFRVVCMGVSPIESR